MEPDYRSTLANERTFLGGRLRQRAVAAAAFSTSTLVVIA